MIEPAIRLARDGFVVDEYRSRSIAGDSARLARLPRLAGAASSPAGAPPAAGSTLRQPDLGRDAGGDPRQRRRGLLPGPGGRPDRGRDGSAAAGSSSHEDLAAYRAIWREPVAITYRGYTIYSMPPASSGGVTMGEILNIMEGYDAAAAVRLRRAAAPRGRGDAARLHRPQHLPRRSGLRAEPDRPAALQGVRRRAARGRSASAPRRRPRSMPAARSGASTTHYSVVDAEGNAVSCTTTLNNSYGSAVTVTGAGFLLNDEMDDFATAPGQAEHVRPGAGRGQRDRARQADALGDDAEHRARPRRAGCCWWWARRAGRGSSRWSIT